MKFKSILLALSTLLLVSQASYAQLSTRQNDTSVFKVGSRPVKGNLGFFIAPSFQEINEISDNDISISGIPLINVKYYANANLVFALGVQAYQSNKIQSGELQSGQVGQFENTIVEGHYEFLPRVEYHFSSNNILDPYLGMSLILGSETNKVEESEQYNLLGDYNIHSIEKSSFVYGFSLFLGTQAFIADLPLALGFEAGIRAKGFANQAFKHVEETSVSGVSSSQTYYTTGNEEGTDYLKYKALNARTFEMGSDVRVTLSYFFNK